MANNVQLNAAMRNNLLSLQNTQKLMDQTQNRLSTGLKVNSAIDNPSSYFTAQGLNQRAGDLEGLLDSMGQGIQTLKAADEGIKALTTLVEQAKAVANQASESNDAAQIAKFAAQYEEIITQMDELAKDSGYKGVNLLNSQDLTIYFNEQSRTTASKIEIEGKDALPTTGLGLGATAQNAWAAPADINDDMDKILAAITTLRTYASDLGNAYSVVQNRENFTESLINVLTEGADKLTLADMNEESANMLALQTRQQLGVNSLSLASQAAQSVLKLF